jgi:hypothetical protein
MRCASSEVQIQMGRGRVAVGPPGRPCERSAIKVPFEIHDRGEGAPPRTEKGFSDSETCDCEPNERSEPPERMKTSYASSQLLEPMLVVFTLNL